MISLSKHVFFSRSFTCETDLLDVEKVLIESELIMRQMYLKMCHSSLTLRSL